MASSSSSSFKQKSPSPSTTSSSTSLDMMVTATPPTITIPERTPDDGSKLKTFLSILRKFIGVADIAAVRFSLPSQLLEPIPNLEYWNYLDRPETFVSMSDSDDPLERMMAVLRFWFTKDLKYVKGKPCKPYNSALGEFFRCTWTVDDDLPSIPVQSDQQQVFKSAPPEKVKVSYLTEQTSHHPPVSAFFISCPEKGIVARGFDQLSAKFTGTSIRVAPGIHNLGIFVNLRKRDDEEYKLTHVAAHLGGLLRGALNITVADTCYVTCPKTRLKCILQYLAEGWIGRTQNRVVGIVFQYDPDNDDKTDIKSVAEEDVLVRLEGCWKEKIYYTPMNSKEQNLLIDVSPLFPVPKEIPPKPYQLSNESQKFWDDVTQAILDKQYGHATRLKHELEERQRQRAAERQARNEEWQPRFFTGAVTPLGKPDLSEEGKRVLEQLIQGRFELEESRVKGA